MKNNNTLVAFLICVLTLLNSCGDFLEIAPPETEAELSKIFSDDQTAVSAVVGMYVQITSAGGGFLNGANTLYPGLSADEIINSSPSSNHEFFRYNNLLSNNSTVRQNFWTPAFRYIYHANAILEGLSASSGLTQQVKERLRGEMLYMRSLNYYYLVNLFGGIPLIRSTDYEINDKMPRSDSSKIYEQIVADLREAEVLLSNSSFVSTRPSKESVQALLSRVYLYLGQWKDAEQYASFVINSGKFKLEEIANVFNSNSNEIIFALSKANANTSEGGQFIPSSNRTRPPFILTDQLLAAFEQGDNRKTAWVNSSTVNNVKYFYPFKYKVRTSTPVTEYNIIQRLSELYLIRAEARTNLGDYTGAIDDINLVRLRAGLARINSRINSLADAMTIILHERQVELFAEWGNRWFDLKRLAKADDVLGSLKGSNWQSTDMLYPIPNAEILKNQFLTQNEGYAN